MSMHTVKLRERRWLANATAAFLLEKPSGYDYIAGQFMEVSLAEAEEGDTSRTFTIASAPHEDALMFATRMRKSPFKRALERLEAGRALQISKPGGDFTLRPAGGQTSVFIAGGIGVTPFRSMIVEAAQQGMREDILLLYSNRRPEDAAFLQELQQIEEQIDKLRLVATITQPEIARISWTGETGRISEAMLKKVLPAIHAALYYIAGPSAMVTAMEEMLRQAGIKDSDVIAEEFSGY